MTGVVALGIVAFWAAVAVFFWAALKPYRVAVAETWELVPAHARGEVGLGLGLAAGVLLTLFVIVGVAVRDKPAPHRTSAPRTRVGVDDDVADIDVDGL